VETPLAIPLAGCGKPWIALVYNVSISPLCQHLRDKVKSDYKAKYKWRANVKGAGRERIIYAYRGKHGEPSARV